MLWSRSKVFSTSKSSDYPHISEDSSPNSKRLLRNTRAIVFKSCIVAIANFDTRHKKMPADTERLFPSNGSHQPMHKEPAQYLVDNLICT